MAHSTQETVRLQLPYLLYVLSCLDQDCCYVVGLYEMCTPDSAIE